MTVNILPETVAMKSKPCLLPEMEFLNNCKEIGFIMGVLTRRNDLKCGDSEGAASNSAVSSAERFDTF